MSDMTRKIRQAAEARATADAAVDAACAAMCAQLRDGRQASGLTQQQIADAIGLSRTQVTNMESGKGASLQGTVAYAAALDSHWTLAPAPGGDDR